MSGLLKMSARQQPYLDFFKNVSKITTISKLFKNVSRTTTIFGLLKMPVGQQPYLSF